MFKATDFEHLAALLSQLKGKLITSLNDVPAICEIFKAFDIEKVATTYTLAKGAKTTPAKEDRRAPERDARASGEGYNAQDGRRETSLWDREFWAMAALNALPV